VGIVVEGGRALVVGSRLIMLETVWVGVVTVSEVVGTATKGSAEFVAAEVETLSSPEDGPTMPMIRTVAPPSTSSAFCAGERRFHHLKMVLIT
jgi:hypothetical protein